MASKANIYLDYFPQLSPAAAWRVLFYFVAGLLLVEVGLRVRHFHYERTAVSSLHGVRAIMQEVLDDPGPKILCFGDSSLVGGGIYDHGQTVVGYLSRQIEGVRVYNLALPGGDSVTSAMLLERLQALGVRNVDRVILETLAGKWIDINPPELRAKRGVFESGKELRRLIPCLDLAAWQIPADPQPLSERTEIAAEWTFGRISALYRNRDFFRTEVTGNYPILWFIGKAMPRSLMAKLNPAKARGTNRLAARANDYNYDPADETKFTGPRQGSFTSAEEQEAMLKGIAFAKALSSKPPILLAFPFFHEMQSLGADDRRTFTDALNTFEFNLDKIARETGSEAMIIRSEEFQNPVDWTATASHFNVSGASKIWEMLRPRFGELYKSRAGY